MNVCVVVVVVLQFREWSLTSYSAGWQELERLVFGHCGAPAEESEYIAGVRVRFDTSKIASAP